MSLPPIEKGRELLPAPKSLYACVDYDAAVTSDLTALFSPADCPKRVQMINSRVRNDRAGDSSLLPMTFNRRPAFNTFHALENWPKRQTGEPAALYAGIAALTYRGFPLIMSRPVSGSTL